MNLYFWGPMSLAFCVLVTIRAAMEGGGTGQSIRDSLLEAWANIVIGFAINYAMNLIVLPELGAERGTELTLINNFWAGWVYTAVSFVRQMGLRRAGNWLMLWRMRRGSATSKPIGRR